jgi:hypothetical protein
MSIYTIHENSKKGAGAYSVNINNHGLVETTDGQNQFKEFDTVSDAYHYHYIKYHKTDYKKCHSHYNLCNQLAEHTDDTNVKIIY